MSAAKQYKKLLEKVATRNNPYGVEEVYSFCMSKSAGAADNLLWAGVGALPAYMLGKSVSEDAAKQKHKNYALAGAAAGFLAPKLLSALVNPAAAFPSTAGFDASDIKSLQLESLN